MTARLLEDGNPRYLEDGTARALEDGGAGGITGTLAVTEAADTLSASGTYTPAAITGTLAQTESADTLSASGTVSGPGAITGTLAVTEAADTLSASGTYTPAAITGTLAQTESADTLSASGTVSGPGAITGTLAVTEASDTLSASGSRTIPAITGTISVVEAADVLAGSGIVTGLATDSHTNKLTIRIRRDVTLGRRNVQARTWQEAGDYAHPWDIKVLVDGTPCDGEAYTSAQITATNLFTGAAVTEWASAKTTGITPGDGSSYSWRVQGESDDFGALPAGAYKLKLTASPGLVHSWRHHVH